MEPLTTSAPTARSRRGTSSKASARPRRSGRTPFRCCARPTRSERAGRPMPQIARESLMSLETYARERQRFRAKVMAQKKDRTVALGEHATLLFEDELTIRYQVQEMLRVERIFEEQGIRDELDAYN